MKKLEILVVIPARGGSKGIPRKNLRALNGKPLIYYSINNALSSELVSDVFVSSDDDEILTISQNFGAQIHKRPKALAEDATTLDPVIYECYKYAEITNNKKYDFVITLQPTSPLLKTQSLKLAIEKLIENDSIDTIISCVNDTHLTWVKNNNKFEPNYEKRLNRQYLKPIYKETGGFLITRNRIISENNRIGKSVYLQELSGGEGIDIDTHEDWALCDYLLRKKKIVFVVRGNKEIGLGHVINTLSIANDILNHEITFFCLKDSGLAYEMIKNNNYKVVLQNTHNFSEEIIALNPSVVINDCLDTSYNYINQFKSNNIKVINIEDLGEGAIEADLVINAMYEKKEAIKNQYFGFEYFILKQEFLHLPFYTIKENVTNVLIAFGGVDPCNLTEKVLKSIHPICDKLNIKITVIAGFGYSKFETIESFDKINVLKSVNNISKHMLEVDIAFSSGGRTTFELASIGVPTIVLCQNERELTHSFCSLENGFANLGLGELVESSTINEKFLEITHSFALRKKMFEKYNEFDLKKGKSKVMNLINNLMNKTT